MESIEMFLNYLNDRESKNFLELANHAMKVNDAVKESVEAVFLTFRKETGLQDYELKDKSYEELVRDFQASTKKIKRVALIELAGIMDADEIVDENEEKWIIKIGHAWGFRDPEIRKMLRWVQDFNDLLIEGYEFINK
jgi:hypothetical protein